MRPRRLRHRPATLVALVAGLCLVPDPSPLAAYPGSCQTRSTKPFLQGFAFRVPSDMDIDAWAERFGFGPLEPPYGDGSERMLLLPRGTLSWNTWPGAAPFEDLDTRIGTPISSRLYYIGDPGPAELSRDEPLENDVSPPPNGALRPLRAIAVVKENYRLVDAYTIRHRWDDDRFIHYAGSFPAPDVGALVHDARYPSGYYRFIFPTDAKGEAARWLASGPRWIGIAFAVADLAATERALAERGVPTVHVREHLGEALWVMPEVTGGPLLEFVQTPYR